MFSILPKDALFKALTDKFKEHFEPKKMIITKRFSFYRRNKDPSETIAAYVAESRRLASTCAFENYLPTTNLFVVCVVSQCKDNYYPRI